MQKLLSERDLRESAIIETAGVSQGHHWRGRVGTRKIQDPAVLRIADGYRNLLPGMFSHPPFSKDSIDGAGLRERERCLQGRMILVVWESGPSTVHVIYCWNSLRGNLWSDNSAQPHRQQTRIAFVIIHLNQVLVSVQQPALHWDHQIGDWMFWSGRMGIYMSSITPFVFKEDLFSFCECTHPQLRVNEGPSHLTIKLCILFKLYG